MALKRQRYQMPEFVEQALNKKGLMELYRQRPPYQQNDYVWWISSPKREATRQKRLQQMLDELQAGAVYMKMPWRSSSYYRQHDDQTL